MLIVGSIIITAVISAFVIAGVQTGVLLTLLLKPILDSTWSGVYVAGLSPTRIFAVLFSVIFGIFAARSSIRITSVPLAPIWITYTLYGVLVATMALLSKGFIAYIDTVFRLLSGIIGWYMMQAYFSQTEKFRTLLKVLLLAGLFPVGIAMYQAATGVVFIERIAVGFTRNVGFYHDAIVLRVYSFQTLAAILLYWSYFLKKNSDNLFKVILIAYAACCLIAIFKLYTKSGYAMIAIWVAIWFMSRKQFIPLIMVLIMAVGANFLMGDRLLDEAEHIYYKEFNAVENSSSGASGERAFKGSFSGRWYVWEEVIKKYSDSSVLEQLIGRGYGAGAHNDYLNRLISSGILGLIIYLVLLVSVGYSVIRNYLANKSPLNVVALMLFTMWILDTIGTVPSSYSNYQWFTWGFIALSLKGISDDTSIKNSASTRPTQRYIHPSFRQSPPTPNS